jgi:multiple sugar transport system substrate-binding protein
MAVAGELPDTGGFQEAATIKWTEEGMLLDLSSMYGEGDAKPLESLAYTFEGNTVAYANANEILLLYYNKDMFLRYGFDPSQTPKNWSEFIEYSKVICAERDDKGNPNVYITNINSSATQLVNLILQAGGQIYDGERARFNEKEGIEALKYLRGLVVDSNVAYLSEGYEGQNDFLASKVAMYEGSSVSMAFMASENKLKFNVGIAPIPSFRTNKNVISGTNIAIFKSNPKKEEAAWKFIKWLTDKEQTAQWSYDTYYMPLRMSALEVSPLKERLANDKNLYDVYDQLNFADTEPSISEWRKTRTDIEKFVLEPIYNENKNLSDQEIQGLLDKVAKDLEDRVAENKDK